MAGICVALFRLDAMSPCQCSRATFEHGAEHGVPIRVTVPQDFSKRLLEIISQRYALANMHPAKWVEVHATRFAQVFVRTTGEGFGRRFGCCLGKPGCSTAAINQFRLVAC